MSEFYPWNAPEIAFAEHIDVAKLQAERDELRRDRDGWRDLYLELIAINKETDNEQ